MATYRARILDTEAAGDGTVHFDCWIQREVETDPGPPPVMGWENVPSGHRTIVLQGSAVLAITQNGSLTPTQKRAALAALFRTEAKNWGIDESDEANEDLLELIPGGSWPVNVSL